MKSHRLWLLVLVASLVAAVGCGKDNGNAVPALDSQPADWYLLAVNNTDSSLPLRGLREPALTRILRRRDEGVGVSLAAFRHKPYWNDVTVTSAEKAISTFDATAADVLKAPQGTRHVPLFEAIATFVPEGKRVWVLLITDGFSEPQDPASRQAWETRSQLQDSIAKAARRNPLRLYLVGLSQRPEPGSPQSTVLASWKSILEQAGLKPVGGSDLWNTYEISTTNELPTAAKSDLDLGI